MEENWRKVPAPGFENYEISIDTPEGRCRRIYKNGHYKIKSNTPNKENRIVWHLCKNGKEYCQQAARWIALTYPELVENEYFEGAEIDHIIPLSVGGTNHPTNLRWVTRKENCNNPITLTHLRETMKSEEYRNVQSKRFLNDPQKSTPVLQYTKDGFLVAEYPSAKEAERQTKIWCGTISNCCKKKPHYNTAGGFKWEYKEKED